MVIVTNKKYVISTHITILISSTIHGLQKNLKFPKRAKWLKNYNHRTQFNMPILTFTLATLLALAIPSGTIIPQTGFISPCASMFLNNTILKPD